MNALKKSALRGISKNRGRYLAILAIVALGVGFFCGLRICRPAMERAGNEYINECNLFDYRLISTLGFTEDDAAYFASLDGVNAAEGAVWADFLYAGEDGNNYALRAHSITQNINRLSLTAGRMPENDDELVADARLFSEDDLGKTLTLSEDNDADTFDLFRHRSYTIVGLVNSAYYLNYERGNTNLGSGTLSGFVYMPYEGFDVDYFSEIFVDIDAPGEIYSDEYDAALDAFEDLLERETESRADLRYRSLVEDAQAEIDDAQAELDEKLADYESEKRDAEDELLDAHAQLEDAEEQIADGEAEIDKNAAKLEDARSEYNSGLKTYRDSKEQFETQKEAALAQIDTAQAEIDSNRAAAEDGIRQIEESGVLENQQSLTDGIAQAQAGIDALEAAREAQLGEASTQLESLKSQRDALQEQLNTLESQRDSLQSQLEALQAQLSGYDADVSAAESERDNSVSALRAQIDSLNGQISGWESEISGLDANDPDQAAQIDSLRGQISSAQSEISSKESAISGAQSDCEARVADLNAQKSSVQSEIDSLGSQITALDEQISPLSAQIDAANAQIDPVQAQLDAANAEFDTQKSALESQISEMQAVLTQIEESGVLDQYAQAQAALTALDSAQSELDQQSAAAQAELDSYQQQLDSASSQLSSAKRQIENGESQLEDARAQLEDAKEELQTGRADYETALIDAETQFMDAEQKFSDAQAEIDDAADEVAEIEPATLYALSRNTNVGYVCFESDSQIVESISTVFPLFFFLVAALVCTTTMTRMVDEERTQIGTLKALGYARGAIMSKYLFYSGSAATLGALIGFFGGSYIFPKIIWMAYGMMYGFAPIPYVLSPLMGVAALAASLLCSVGATWASCNAELSETPAQLIRPKSPKAGKRILLERVGFIWHHLSFLHKVTLRNVFRYKKRLMMMVVGIGGCTALLVTGFGINDSIANVVNDQYDRIMLYDLSASFIDDPTDEEQSAFVDALGADAADTRFIYEGSADVAYGDQTRAANMLVCDGALDGFIDLHADDAPLAFPGTGECAVSSGLAERCGLNVGDTVAAYDGEMNRLDLTVSAVFDNYVYNYLIVSAQTVADQWGAAPSANTALINCADGADDHALSARISEMDNVSNVSVNSDIRTRFSSMLSSLNYVILMVIICAAALAFIVLYNLTNININERLREIATVKVLGFTLHETASYALSENIVLSAIGALVGLPLGRVLHRFVMAQIKVDLVQFDVRVLPLSMALSVAMTLGFALLVNLFMLRRIDRIDMAESLKTVE